MAMLNACDGGTVSPSRRASFPELFLGYFGDVAFVGPEYRVPDEFAFEFARVYYALLFRVKEPGLALFKARWFFVKKYNNPMGLFYALYANGDVKLEGPERSVYL
jgi:hypothetical protein